MQRHSNLTFSKDYCGDYSTRCVSEYGINMAVVEKRSGIEQQALRERARGILSGLELALIAARDEHADMRADIDEALADLRATPRRRLFLAYCVMRELDTRRDQASKQLSLFSL